MTAVGINIRHALTVERNNELMTVVSGTLKISTNWAQMMAILSRFEIDWGDTLSKAISSLMPLSSAVTSSTSFQCVASLSYDVRALVWMICAFGQGPVAHPSRPHCRGLAGLPLLSIVAPPLVLLLREALQRRWRPQQLVQIWTTTSMVLLWMMHPLVTLEALRVLRCFTGNAFDQGIPEGGWLHADLSVQCHGETYERTKFIANAVLCVHSPRWSERDATDGRT